MPKPPKLPVPHELILLRTKGDPPRIQQLFEVEPGVGRYLDVEHVDEDAPDTVVIVQAGSAGVRQGS